MTLLERIDNLRKLAEAEENGREIQFRVITGGWIGLAYPLADRATHILGNPSDYRIKPEPVTRLWSKPEDVPGPVCWLRAKGSLDCGVMILGIHSQGVLIARHNGQHPTLQRWDEFTDDEYSTDRKTWSACTVTVTE